MKPPLQLSLLSLQQLQELNELYHTTKDVRLRTRAQTILLAVEQGMTASAIAQIVRECDQTVGAGWSLGTTGISNPMLPF
jgi:DNA-binding NarL/FixJ family response regulator